MQKNKYLHIRQAFRILEYLKPTNRLLYDDLYQQLSQALNIQEFRIMSMYFYLKKNLSTQFFKAKIFQFIHTDHELFWQNRNRIYGHDRVYPIANFLA